MKYGLGNGIYQFRDVPKEYPIAFLNHGKWTNVTYLGEVGKNKTVTGPDGKIYQYMWGGVVLTVTGDFGTLSYHASGSGYLGGQDRLVYVNECGDSSFNTTTTTIAPTTINPLFLGTTTTTTTTTTTLPVWVTTTTTTTTTTTLPQSSQYCLQGSNSVTFSVINGTNSYIFNGNYGSYGLVNGTYTLNNVSSAHPIAIHNSGSENLISYTGSYLAGTKQALDGNTYDYFYGDVTITVGGDFEATSYECYYHGYMGGQNNIIYDNTNCT